LADDLPRAPVEPEGYKKMINLPDWHAWHSLWVKAGMRFFTVLSLPGRWPFFNMARTKNAVFCMVPA